MKTVRIARRVFELPDEVANLVDAGQVSEYDGFFVDDRTGEVLWDSERERCMPLPNHGEAIVRKSGCITINGVDMWLSEGFFFETRLGGRIMQAICDFVDYYED
jgi:hypothetical protein